MGDLLAVAVAGTLGTCEPRRCLLSAVLFLAAAMHVILRAAAVQRSRATAAVVGTSAEPQRSDESSVSDGLPRRRTRSGGNSARADPAAPV